tara:strand:- start:1276 stop:1452 length:177 start_codon:yes stop_codon:yes gene_type:complete
MDIDTDKPLPKPIEQIVPMIKEISKDLSDIKADLLFIKAKLKEREALKESIEKSWWLF